MGIWLQYILQLVVGQLQWVVTLGRFVLHAQVATMSRFRAAPRQGHMDRLKRIYSYAIRTNNRTISRESKSFVSCSHMNCCLQKHTTYQFTYIMYCSYQDKFKNSRIMKIHQVHQKIHTKQFYDFM